MGYQSGESRPGGRRSRPGAGGVPGPGREAFPADTRPDTGGGRTRTGDWPALALRGLASVPAPHCGTMSR